MERHKRCQQERQYKFYTFSTTLPLLDMEKLFNALKELYASFPLSFIYDFGCPAPVGQERPNYEAIDDFLKTQHELSAEERNEIAKFINDRRKAESWLQEIIGHITAIATEEYNKNSYDVISDEDIRKFITWAMEFQEAHKNTKWDEFVDFDTEIEEFTLAKLN